MKMKWFNLPGEKEAYIQGVKHRWVNDTKIDVPWLNFSIKSPTNYDFFVLAFPDQAWILRQIYLIDESIDEALDHLEKMVPNSCKSRSWIERTVHSESFFDYYFTTLKQRQRDSILHYAEVLSLEEQCDTVSEGLRLEAFRSACVGLVETACLKDRARLVEALFSLENTAPLLSAQPYANMSFMAVRCEALRRGLALQKAMHKMREALGMEERDSEDEEDEQKNDGDGYSDSDGEKREDGFEKEDGGHHNRKDCDKSILGLVDKGAQERDDRRASPAGSTADTVAAESQFETPVHGCSSDGTAMENTACELECGWISVLDGTESLDC
jgi:hypothetical protein